MKVVGFTIIRNAIKFDYPVVESIKSILPICDEFVVAVGKSEDATLELIRSIPSKKIRILETEWDLSHRKGGELLAIETNKAKEAIGTDADWCFYIQSDEVVHEQYLPAIKAGMKQYVSNPKVEGLLFDYVHFYGSYDYIGDSRKWYRREVRIIRNDAAIRSYRDAQGFRKNSRKLKVKRIPASIYHYGWVKPPEKQLKKQESFHKMWHEDRTVKEKIGDARAFDYSNIDSLALFVGTHPDVMQERIKRKNWTFSHDLSKKNLSLKYRALHWIEQQTGWRIGEYKNYKLI